MPAVQSVPVDTPRLCVNNPYAANVLSYAHPVPQQQAPAKVRRNAVTFACTRPTGNEDGDIHLVVTTRGAHSYNQRSDNTTVLDVRVRVPDPKNARTFFHDATLRRDGAYPKMFHTADGTPYLEEVVRALAAVGAFYGITTGGEVWRISCLDGPFTHVKRNYAQKIPFSIARGAIKVVDASAGNLEVAVLTTRGRNGAYTTTSCMSGGAPRDLAAAECGCVSHPQLPLMRVIVANAASGVMRLAAARVKWQADDELDAVAPQAVSLTEIADDAAAPTVAWPVIRLGVNPVNPSS